MRPVAQRRVRALAVYLVCRLGRCSVTYDEMEKSLIALRDNQVVQGEILNRLELAVERNNEAIARNSDAIARNSDAFAKLADGFLLLQAAMKGLAETVDRFIKGLEANGDHGRR